MDFLSLFSSHRDLPFSFVYNGKSSSELLPGWAHVNSSQSDFKGRLACTTKINDANTGLAVECEYIVYAGYPAVDWVVRFTNESEDDLPILEAINAMNLNIKTKGDIVLHHSNGSTCASDDFLPFDEHVPIGTNISIAPNYGRSSDGHLPFFNLQWDEEGLIVAIGWTGQWIFNLVRNGDDTISLKAGQQFTHMSLHPGETIRTPRILLINWNGNDSIIGHNMLRRMILEYYTPQIDGKQAIPGISANTWNIHDTGNAVNERNQLDFIKKASKLGIENYWLDAGWFEGGWPDGVGNWFPRKDAFPRGLKPLGDAARKRGMGFVLWFEPERVTPGTRIATEHPEWVLHVTNGDTAPCGQDLTKNELFNLGIPEARKWLTDTLVDCMKEAGVTIYRHDFNIFGATRFWEEADASNRIGMTENLHIQGLYQMWDEMRARMPNLAIDNCASGGRRIDLETISRSYILWQSDTQCCGYPAPVQDQVQNSGLDLYVPLHSAGVWDFEPYIWRSVTTTGVCLCMDIQDKKYKKNDIIRRINEAKSLREYRLGDYYPLTGIGSDEEKWIAWQFDRADLGKGIAIFLRRSKSGYKTFQAELKNIDPAAMYRIAFLDTGKKRRIKGKDLEDIEISIDSTPGSMILMYEKL